MPDHDSTSSSTNWANLRAEQVLKRHLAGIEVPTVPARTMRERIRRSEELRFTTDAVPVTGPGGPAGPSGGGVPHDWRWFVGGVGRVLISLGLLIFAFVAYQLWGTGIQYARAQDQLEREFEEQLGEFVPVSTLVTSVAPTLAGATDSSTADSVSADTVAAPPTSAALPGEPVEVALGGVLGVIEIPKIEVKDYIVAGVRTSDLDKGVGHYPFTPLPGQTGNVAIAGHRTTHGEPFNHLDRLVAGDEIVVTTVQGQFVYSVVGTKIVDPTDFTVLYGDAEHSQLTLTTCHPRYSQKQRLVVSAELVPGKSQYTDTDIAYDATDIPSAEEPTGSDAATESTIAGGSDSSSTDTPGLVDEIPDEAQDAFSSGWFSDDAAWPQIALWGFALTAFSLAMTWLGRRTRRWISLVVGIAPFVVLLYFWFENVNRMMPPNL